MIKRKAGCCLSLDDDSKPKPSKRSSYVTVSLAALLMLCAPTFAQTDSTIGEAKAPLTTKQILDAIRKDARKDFSKAAEALRALKPAGMSDEDQATWVRLSRESAVRTGDAGLLRALKDKDDPFALIPLSRILLANGYLNEGKFDDAQAELNRIPKLDHINVRDRRRYWALKARIAQLTGDIKAERVAIEQIVHELGHWASPTCQSCHDDPKVKGVIVPLNIRDFWFSKRLVELLKIQGDADNVATTARKKLVENAKNEDALLFLALAQFAKGDEIEAEATLRAIPWVPAPRADATPPRMIFAWP